MLLGLPAAQGTIEHAVGQVEAFRGVLEHRVVARFDVAVAGGDLGGMSECARIMAEFCQGESQLVQVRMLAAHHDTTFQQEWLAAQKIQHAF